MGGGGIDKKFLNLECLVIVWIVGLFLSSLWWSSSYTGVLVLFTDKVVSVRCEPSAEGVRNKRFSLDLSPILFICVIDWGFGFVYGQGSYGTQAERRRCEKQFKQVL